jgi:hypothetical protein
MINIIVVLGLGLHVKNQVTSVIRLEKEIRGEEFQSYVKALQLLESKVELIQAWNKKNTKELFVSLTEIICKKITNDTREE